MGLFDFLSGDSADSAPYQVADNSTVDRIIGAESGGDPNAQNSRSSAGGLGQFIDSTWLDTLRKHRPDLTDGKSDSELLALKKDPDLSREMTGAYASDNGAILAKAGHPVTPANTYLAHFAGPGGAVSVLNADPSTPVSAILPGAMKANPFLNGMTAADLQAWAQRKVGGAQQPATQTASLTRTGTPATALPLPVNLTPPIFAPPPQQQDQASAPGVPYQPPPQAAPFQIPQAPPIFAPPRRQIDLSKLRAALAQNPYYYGKQS